MSFIRTPAAVLALALAASPAVAQDRVARTAVTVRPAVVAQAPIRPNP